MISLFSQFGIDFGSYKVRIIKNGIDEIYQDFNCVGIRDQRVVSVGQEALKKEVIKVSKSYGLLKAAK